MTTPDRASAARPRGQSYPATSQQVCSQTPLPDQLTERLTAIGQSERIEQTSASSAVFHLETETPQRAGDTPPAAASPDSRTGAAVLATPEPDNTPPSRSAASFLTRQLNALIRAYRLPVSQDPPAERTPRRRGRPRRDYPLSDEYFAEQISALYLRRHSEDPLRQGVISPSQFNRLRRGSASDTSTERAQAIAEFFGVDLSYLKPTLASSVVSAPGAETNTSASRANTPLAGPRASAISSISSSAFQSLSNDLAARGERVFVIVDDVAQPLNHLSAEQLTLLAHRIEDALMVARRALGEFAAPTVPDPGAPTDAPVPLRSSAAAAMPDARSEQPEQRTEPSEGVSPLQPATP